MIFTLASLGFLCLAAAQSISQTSAFSSSFSGTSTLVASSVIPSSSLSLNVSSSSSATPTSSAQFPTLSGYSTCVTNCLQLGVANAGCPSVTEVNCFCGRQNFTAEIFSCASRGCPTDLPIAEKLAQSFCDLASTSASLSFPSSSSEFPSTSLSTSTVPVTSSTSSGTSISNASSSPSSTSSSAASRNVQISLEMGLHVALMLALSILCFFT